MKSKQFYTKLFSHKKILTPFFITIVVLQLIMVILSVVQEQHWMIFTDSLLNIGLIIAVFCCHRFDKIKAARVLQTLIFFFQAAFLAAYSFMPYPKSPDAASGMFSFIIYLVYAMSFFALAISALVLHANLNKQRNEGSIDAMYIIYTIQVAISLILIIGSIINFAKAGCSCMAMADFVDYFAYGLTSFYIITLETLNPNKIENKK